MNPTEHLYEIIALLSILCGLMIFVLLICGILLVKSKRERKRLKNEVCDLHLKNRQHDEFKDWYFEKCNENEKLKAENKELYKTLANKP